MAQLYQNLSHKGEAEFASLSTVWRNAAETAALHAVAQERDPTAKQIMSFSRAM